VSVPHGVAVEPNALNRFGVGTKNKDLKLGEDASLTLYIQHASPGPDKQSNWLPAPAGRVLALYPLVLAGRKAVGRPWQYPRSIVSSVMFHFPVPGKRKST
jgi:hypothetical protein